MDFEDDLTQTFYTNDAMLSDKHKHATCLIYNMGLMQIKVRCSCEILICSVSWPRVSLVWQFNTETIQTV